MLVGSLECISRKDSSRRSSVHISIESMSYVLIVDNGSSHCLNTHDQLTHVCLQTGEIPSSNPEPRRGRRHRT